MTNIVKLVCKDENYVNIIQIINVFDAYRELDETFIHLDYQTDKKIPTETLRLPKKIECDW
jgi:hypothetical protein